MDLIIPFRKGTLCLVSLHGFQTAYFPSPQKRDISISSQVRFHPCTSQPFPGESQKVLATVRILYLLQRPFSKLQNHLVSPPPSFLPEANSNQAFALFLSPFIALHASAAMASSLIFPPSRRVVSSEVPFPQPLAPLFF